MAKRGRPPGPKKDTLEKKKPGRPKKDPKPTPPKPTPPPAPRPGYVVNPQHPLDIQWGRNPRLVKVKNGTGDTPGLYVANDSVGVDEFNRQQWKWEAPCINGYGIYTPVRNNNGTINAKHICNAVEQNIKYR